MRTPLTLRLFSRIARPWMSLFATWTVLSFLPMQLAAQQDDGPPPPGTPMYTLHVYTNLVQVPTLVLNQDLKPFPPLSKDQFTLSLDGGPTFRPTQVHLEGADPIVMAILLDVSGTEAQLIRKASTAIASLPHALTPRDRVALFAFDCSVASAPQLIEPDPEKLRIAVEELLKTASLHGPKGSPPNCYHRGKVWNSMASVINSVSKFPGRRVMIAVTDALDYNSKITRANLQEFAVGYSVPIFALDFDNRVPNPLEIYDIRTANADLQILTSGTGGLILPTAPDIFADTLQRIVTLLRGRYIIEFPRPSNSTNGSHIIDVKVPKRNAVIRSAGVNVPLPGDKELNDPDNVPSDPTRAPTIGKPKKSTR